MFKFKSKTLIDMYGDNPNNYDIAFLHYALKIRNNSSKEYKLLERDYDNLKKEVKDNQFKIYFYDINSFKEVIDNTNIFNKYHDYIYVRINNKDELDKLSKLIDKKVNAIIDYQLFDGFSVSNINLILNVDKIKELTSNKLLELSNKYHINEVCLGTNICLNKEYCYDLINEYRAYYGISLKDDDIENNNIVLKLFISNDIYSIEEYIKIEKELYKLIDNNEDEYLKFYNLYYNIVSNSIYNYNGLNEEENDNQNLIGVLINKKGVCESFAKTLYQACSLVNIKCIIVSGGSSKSDGGHIWNKVCINGIWFNADAAGDSNFLKEKGRLYLCLVSDNSILYKSNSIVDYECIYNYDLFTHNLTTNFLYNNNFIIKYNEDDNEYINELNKYIDNEINCILEFFDIKELKKKIVINLFDSLDKYKNYRKGNISDSSVGNFDMDEFNYYVNVLSYKEYIKRKGYESKTIEDYFKLIIHELIHAIHVEYGTLYETLIWIREGFAIYKSHQYEGKLKRLNKCTLKDLLENKLSSYINYYVLIDYAFNKYGEDYIKNLISNPDIQIEETKKIFNDYLSENRLERYKAWCVNYSFFGYNSFVIDEIDFLYQIINIIGPTFEDSEKLKVNDFSKINRDEIIELAQGYFDKHNIKLNILDEIKNGNLILEDGLKDKDDYLSTIQDGYSNYVDDKIIAKVVLSNTIFDSLVIVHELTHNRNQPIGKRNITSDLLTESVSYVNEFIFVDEFLNDKDKSNYFKGLEKMLYSYAYNLYLIYRFVILYKEQSDIYEDNYNKVFHDDYYDDVLDHFEEYVENNKSIYKDSYFVLGFTLSIYMFMEYKKDNKIFKEIEEFNDSINKLGFNECLNIIGIKDLNHLIDKFKINVLEFKEYIKNMNEK